MRILRQSEVVGSQKQNSALISIPGRILSPYVIAACLHPLSNVSFSGFLSGCSPSLLSFLVPVFAFLPLTWPVPGPLPFQCEPVLRHSSLLSSSQTLFCSHLADGNALLKSYLSCAVLPLATGDFSRFFSVVPYSLPTVGAGWRDRYSNSASGSWIRSGASKRVLGTQKGVTYTMEWEV